MLMNYILNLRNGAALHEESFFLCTYSFPGNHFDFSLNILVGLTLKFQPRFSNLNPLMLIWTSGRNSYHYCQPPWETYDKIICTVGSAVCYIQE